MIGIRSTRASTMKRSRVPSLNSPSTPTQARKKIKLRDVRVQLEPCETAQSTAQSTAQFTALTAAQSTAQSAAQSLKLNDKTRNRETDEKMEIEMREREEREESSSQSDENVQLDIDARRRKNMEKNALFLASLGLNTFVSSSGQSKSGGSSVKKPRPLKKREKKAPPPRRVSRRLQRITPEGAQLPPEPEPEPPQPEHPRQPVGPAPLRDHVWERNDDENLDDVMKVMRAVTTEKPQSRQLDTRDSDKFISTLRSMRLQHFVKAVPERIFSLAFHPSRDKLLAMAGDKWGHVAYWNLVEGSSGLSTFVPHSRPVNHILGSAHDYSKVFTASYDGTLRVTDLNKAQYYQIYATDEDDDIRLTRFDFLTAQSLLVSQGDGCVTVVDTRTSQDAARSFHLHDRLVKCVNVHPRHNDYFITATNGGEVSIWDVRRVSSKRPLHPVVTLPHSKSVDAAHFSPVTGRNIVTTCYSNKLHVYDSSDISNVKQTNMISHDNQTGRWLTNFRAEFHPQRDDLFVIGSMKRPRQIELVSTRGQVVRTFSDDLSSVCSLNAFHSTHNALVGGNSSGKLVAYYA